MTDKTTSLATLNWLIWAIPAGMLFLAVLPLPYGYYQFLRLVVCGFAGFLAWQEVESSTQITPIAIMFGLIALLMNPVIPVHLSKGLWVVLDLVMAGAFVWHRAQVARRAA